MAGRVKRKVERKQNEGKERMLVDLLGGGREEKGTGKEWLVVG